GAGFRQRSESAAGPDGADAAGHRRAAFLESSWNAGEHPRDDRLREPSRVRRRQDLGSEPGLAREYPTAASPRAVSRGAAADGSVPHKGPAGADSGAEEILKKLSAFSYQLSAFAWKKRSAISFQLSALACCLAWFSGCGAVNQPESSKVRAIIGAVL